MIVVTGGCGFIGGHLVDALVKEHEVTVIDNGLTGDYRNPEAWYIRRDLGQKDENLDFDFSGADTVFHVAALARTAWCAMDPQLCWETNVMGSVQVLEAARRADVRRVVLSSSNIVYGSQTPYRASKLGMELAAEAYRNLYGLSTICLRYGNTYGPRQSEDGYSPNVFASLRKSMREEGFARLSGDGEQTRQYIHVSDVVRANLLAAQSDWAGELDITTGVDTSLNTIAKMLECKVRYGPDRDGDAKHLHQDPQEAEEVLGFKALVPLEEGIWDSFPRLHSVA